MGAIADHLATLSTSAERAAYKVAQFSLLPAGGFTASPGVTVTWTKPRVDERGRLSLTITLRDRGVIVPLDNPFQFVNPPVLVPDPAGDIVHGDARYRESLPDAIRIMVTDALRGLI